MEQFRPDVMARLGLGYDDVKAMNPHAVYCSITGYGQDGPRCNEAGHDLNYIASTGLLVHGIITAAGTALRVLPVPIDPGFHAAPGAVPTTRPGADDGVI